MYFYLPCSSTYTVDRHIRTLLIGTNSNFWNYERTSTLNLNLSSKGLAFCPEVVDLKMVYNASQGATFL